MQRTADASARPDPDQLLARVRREQDDAGRGSLRIYFGASAGVGKTYAMLQGGRRLAAEGRDVVVGVVETHGRSETAALLLADDDGPALPILPRANVARGADDTSRLDEEFDLDGALARRPQLILVDELAHSNVPGSRHQKRWQDVDELLAAGIDVFTTLNVQHLESLNDIVGGITGIRVWETVPDTFFDRADEVVMVDVSADELLKRLSAGKVYLPEQAERAAKNFFRRGNLIALREIALRRTADRVEDDVQAYREERAIERVWGTEAALLCCVGPDPGAERVVRGAARLASQLDVEWHAVYVETPSLSKLRSDARERILAVVQLAQQLGASTTILSGSDVGEVVARYAREHNLSRVVLGRANPLGPLARALGRVDLASRVTIHAPELDLVVVGGAHARTGAAEAPLAAGTTARRAGTADSVDDPRRTQRRLTYAWAAAACAAVTVAALPLWMLLHPTNIAMLYLLVVALVAMRFGRGPAAFASFVAVGCFDFFFVPPRYSFAVSDVQYLVTFAVMLTVALVIGTLAANLRYQARVAAHREDRARSLYEIARDLSKALRSEDVVARARSVIGNLFEADVELLLPADATDPDDGAARRSDRLAIDDALARSAGFEPAIPQWSYEHSRPAGAGTDTLSGSPWIFLPLQTPVRSRGVLAVRPMRRRLLMIPEQRRLLETLAALVAIALERVHYVEVAQRALLGVESERLRNSILSALSHDLRTPIAAIAGLAETLAMRPSLAPDDAVLVDALRGELRRIGTLVENLLDMARIESGTVSLDRQWHSIEETVGSALAAMGRSLDGHVLDIALARDLPLFDYDAVLLERVLVNLLENAGKYSGDGSTIRIAATAERGEWHLTVEDDGPGLPAAFQPSDRSRTLFDKFTRGESESARGGVGLGLAICRSIVEAHGGSIAVESPSTGGVRFVVSMPRREPPVIEDEPDTPAAGPGDDAAPSRGVAVAT